MTSPREPALRRSGSRLCSAAFPHHRDVWPLRDRAGVCAYVALSWLLLWISLGVGRYWPVPFAVWFIYRSQRAFTRQWIAACERFGVDEKETRGL